MRISINVGGYSRIRMDWMANAHPDIVMLSRKRMLCYQEVESRVKIFEGAASTVKFSITFSLRPAATVGRFGGWHNIVSLEETTLINVPLGHFISTRPSIRFLLYGTLRKNNREGVAKLDLLQKFYRTIVTKTSLELQNLIFGALVF